MYYVEFLRVLRGLRVIAIILGVFFLLAVVGRIASGPASTPSFWISHVRESSTAVVHQQTLSDGTTKITIDDAPKRTHAVILDHGYNGITFTITTPKSEVQSDDSDNHLNFGSIRVDKTISNGIATVTGDTDSRLDLMVLFAFSVITGLIIASVLGGPFAKENNGHLELAWTKPVSRERYALATIGIDVAGIVAAQMLTVVAELLMVALFEVPHPVIGAGSWVTIALALLVPVAWYALITACSASIRALGIVMGIVWPVGIILPVLASVHWSPSALGQTLRFALRAIDTLNPIVYFSLQRHMHVDSQGTNAASLVASNATTSLLVLVVLTVVYLGAAVLQWRRVEA